MMLRAPARVRPIKAIVIEAGSGTEAVFVPIDPLLDPGMP